MIASLQNVLVIGGGFSGMATAIQCAKLGLSVELVEIDQGWRSYGAGISIGGPTLRALRTIGVLDAFFERGYGGDGVNLFTAGGHPIGTLATPRVAGDDVPGGGAIMRPVLADILAKATRAAGVQVRLGCTFTQIEQRGNRSTRVVHGRYAGPLRPCGRGRRLVFESARSGISARAEASLHGARGVACRGAAARGHRLRDDVAGSEGQGGRESGLAR